jgi:hypothetical protein
VPVVEVDVLDAWSPQTAQHGRRRVPTGTGQDRVAPVRHLRTSRVDPCGFVIIAAPFVAGETLSRRLVRGRPALGSSSLWPTVAARRVEARVGVGGVDETATVLNLRLCVECGERGCIIGACAHPHRAGRQGVHPLVTAARHRRPYLGPG